MKRALVTFFRFSLSRTLLQLEDGQRDASSPSRPVLLQFRHQKRRALQFGSASGISYKTLLARSLTTLIKHSLEHPHSAQKCFIFFFFWKDKDTAQNYFPLPQSIIHLLLSWINYSLRSILLAMFFFTRSFKEKLTKEATWLNNPYLFFDMDLILLSFHHINLSPHLLSKDKALSIR